MWIKSDTTGYVIYTSIYRTGLCTGAEMFYLGSCLSMKIAILTSCRICGIARMQPLVFVVERFDVYMLYCR